MARANPDLPGLPDEVRAQLRSGASADRRKLAGEENSAALCRDAATPITVWDRRSMKTDLVTGRLVPDETRRVPLLAYANPRPAEWPAADFIVGNPPFIGDKRMRDALGDGYTETLRAAYPEVPESADFVLYWWHKAATLVRAGKAKRFGLITTNSLRQTFARRVVQLHLDGRSGASADRRKPSAEVQEAALCRDAATKLSLVFAIPDHPWVDTAEGAAVRIAMTVGAAGEHPGELLEVTAEQPQDDGSEKVTFKSQRGKISADLTVGANLSTTVPLKANDMLASTGLILGGRGFVLSEDEAKSLKRGRTAAAKIIYPLRNGEDLTGVPRNAFVIDTNGWSEEQLRSEVPEIYQHLLTTVYPERKQNRDPKLRKQWWLFRRSNEQVRGAMAGLPRFIVTAETAKHRLFMFLEAGVKPEHRLIVTGLDDAFHLGVLSSRVHVAYSLAAGGTLEDRPVYNKSRCFDPFPFPLCGAAERERIRKLAEELDAHRKRVQAQHSLTLTGLYNVLEKLRAADGPRAVPARSASPETATLENPNAPDLVHPLRTGTVRAPAASLTAKEKLIHDQGLVSVLKQLHDDLDAAVFAAYGWPANLTDAEILERLVALNAERAAEEKRGIIHWLRPEYQNRGGASVPASRDLLSKEALAATTRPKKKIKAREDACPTGRKTDWPKSLAERVQAVETALHAVGDPITPAELAKQFKRAQAAAVLEILQTLVTLGRARQHGGRFGQ